MFDFDQYLGFLAFLTILTIGFWLMIFLASFIPYWIGGAIMEMVKEKQAERKAKKHANR
jgi:cytochrome b subunit of formate dehydrogenase